MEYNPFYFECMPAGIPKYDRFYTGMQEYMKILLMLSQEIANEGLVPKSRLFNPVDLGIYRCEKYEITLYVFVQSGKNNFQTHPFK